MLPNAPRESTLIFIRDAFKGRVALNLWKCWGDLMGLFVFVLFSNMARDVMICDENQKKYIRAI